MGSCPDTDIDPGLPIIFSLLVFNQTMYIRGKYGLKILSLELCTNHLIAIFMAPKILSFNIEMLHIPLMIPIGKSMRQLENLCRKLLKSTIIFTDNEQG